MATLAYPHTIRAFSTFIGATTNKSWNLFDLTTGPTKIGYLFQAEVTGSITQLCFKFQSATASSSGVIKVGIQSATTSGSWSVPDGTYLGSVNVSWSQATQAGTTVEATLGTSISVTKGNLYYFVLEYVSGSTLSLGTWVDTVSTASGLSGTTYWNGSTWTGVNAQAPVFGYYVGQWYGNIYKDIGWSSTGGASVTEGNIITFNTDASITSLQLSKVSAIVNIQTAFATTSTPLKVKVGSVSGTTYTDITSTTIATALKTLVVKDAGSTQWAMEYTFQLPTDVNVPTNTPVYIGIESNGGDGNNRALTTLYTTQQSTAHWACWTQCSNGYFATLSGTTLTTDTLKKCWHNYHFSGVTTSASGGGGSSASFTMFNG